MHNDLSRHLDGDSKSARCLFIDYSPAFNTMQPQTLKEGRSLYNVPAKLQLSALDFLTNRQQYVRKKADLSSIITINTGASQGCVLSPFLFIAHTNVLSMFL